LQSQQNSPVFSKKLKDAVKKAIDKINNLGDLGTVNKETDELIIEQSAIATKLEQQIQDSLAEFKASLATIQADPAIVRLTEKFITTPRSDLSRGFIARDIASRYHELLSINDNLQKAYQEVTTNFANLKKIRDFITAPSPARERALQRIEEVNILVDGLTQAHSILGDAGVLPSNLNATTNLMERINTMFPQEETRAQKLKKALLLAETLKYQELFAEVEHFKIPYKDALEASFLLPPLDNQLDITACEAQASTAKELNYRVTGGRIANLVDASLSEVQIWNLGPILDAAFRDANCGVPEGTALETFRDGSWFGDEARRNVVLDQIKKLKVV
jgi:hypothetical protein